MNKITIDEVWQRIKSGSKIVASMAAAEPTLFYASLHRFAKDKGPLNVYGANPTQAYPCFSDVSLAPYLDLRMMFLTSAVRKLQGRDLLHYVPCHLSQWSKNVFPEPSIDVFWGSCTPPDERGFVSLGIGACYEPDIIRKANLVVLEVNQHMPLTWGGTQFPLKQVDCLLENHHELFSITSEVPDAIDRKIASYIADLIEDGSTIQLGIGALPNAVAEALSNKKNLGVHTELINDAMMKLTEAGVITGSQKTIWPGKMVGTFALGSPELYKFMDKNPMIELHPASVINDPYRIGRNYKMISVNTAVEIDLTGQVCSESVGHRELSGVGGAFDTHSGAQRSVGGRGIIAVRSRDPKSMQSKIVGELKQGAKVTISRNDIDTIVTEFGVARLKGKSVAQRAEALIGIADPVFKEELLHFARKEKYI